MEKITIHENGQWTLEKGLFDKQSKYDHPELFSNHGGIIPADHPDRPHAVKYINKLLTGGHAQEARRLYDKHLAGGGAYVKGVNKAEDELADSIEKVAPVAAAIGRGVLTGVAAHATKKFLDKD